MSEISYAYRTILVTGANGQLGRRLLPRLIDAGYTVKAHYRSQEKAQKYCPSGIEYVLGDLREPVWLDRAVRGCDVVIHGAARVSLRPGQFDEQHKINVDGTKAAVDACLKNNVKKMIYVSSIVTVGASADGKPIDESAPFNLAGFGIPYVETKHEAEMLALGANRSGFEVVSVNPSIMISPPDREVTSADLRKIPRWLPAYFDFGLNVVETDDVIRGIIAAIEKGRAGERYLLTGENVDAGRVFELAQKYLGISKPGLKIPLWVLIPAAWIAEISAGFRHKRPKFHRGLAKLGGFRFFYSNDKAKRELGFNPKSLNVTIENILEKLQKYNLKKGKF